MWVADLKTCHWIVQLDTPGVQHLSLHMLCLQLHYSLVHQETVDFSNAIQMVAMEKCQPGITRSLLKASYFALLELQESLAIYLLSQSSFRHQ